MRQDYCAGRTREAEYYERENGGAVVCRLCPNGCTLAEGQRGLCHNRVNTGGRLMAEAYGRVCAVAADPVEKKPLLHFHPGGRCLSLAAAGCNLACRWCQNHAISQAAAGDVPSRRLAPADVARLAREAGCRMVAYTYTEPRRRGAAGPRGRVPHGGLHIHRTAHVA